MQMQTERPAVIPSSYGAPGEGPGVEMVPPPEGDNPIEADTSQSDIDVQED